MAFIHGRRSRLLYNGHDLSRFFREASSAQAVETAETSAFGTTAKTFIPGMESGTFSASGMFDGALDATDAVLSAVFDTDAGNLMTLAPEGLSHGKPSYSAKIRNTSYEVSSPVTDVVGTSLEAEADGGIDRGVLAAAAAAVTSAGTGTSIDNAASSTAGAVGFLHVTANTRDGSSTFKVQHSSDNVVFVDLITFTTVAGSTTASERIAVTGTVNRYIRASHAPGGSTGSVTYTVAFARK